MLLITTEAAAYGKSHCEIHIKADPAPHNRSKPYKRKQTSRFVPYSRITASVSLYTTSCSPFLPVCLTSRRPLTIFFSLRPLSFPYFSLLFLSSLLSHAHISLIFLSHISLIPPAFLPHSSPPPTTLPKPEVTKSDKKKKQAADTGNPSGKKKSERTSQIQESRQKQTPDRKHKEGTGQGKTI